jgi:hypothetical protein
MRFRYHDRFFWYRIKLKEDEQQKNSPAEKVADIQEGLEQVLAESFTYFANGAPPPKGWITCHYPPDEERDWQKTADWLFEPKRSKFQDNIRRGEPAVTILAGDKMPAAVRCNQLQSSFLWKR